MDNILKAIASEDFLVQQIQNTAFVLEVLETIMCSGAV
jgi:hypothetical protein